MKKIFPISLLATCYLLLATNVTHAMCPVCTIGVAAGLGIAEKYGISDVISGIWIGGLLVSITLWTIDWLKKKKWSFLFYKPICLIFYFASVIWPLYAKGKIGHPFHKFWGIDKLILGILFGSLFFVLGALIYEILKKKNGGHAHFPFEKVVIPISPLIILSVIFYYLTK